MLIYWWIAVLLDYGSTIVVDWTYEENPLMRAIWRDYGDIGFTVASLLFGAIFSLVYYYGYRYTKSKMVMLAMFLMVTFKILIALTNLALIPYWVTGWFQFSYVPMW